MALHRQPFEALYAEPARLKELLRPMSGISRPGNMMIARSFPWSKYRRPSTWAPPREISWLVETMEGFDYTDADCSSWMKEAGFRETRVQHLVVPDSMVIGIK
jgi:hypothetical protein